MKKLNEEIVQYLTPWAFDDFAEIKFGEKVYASSIINFIEEREYVDFITDFLMLVCRKGCCDQTVEAIRETNKEEDVLASIKGCNDLEVLLQDQAGFIGDIVAVPSTSRSLLVSAPKHIIIPYHEPDKLKPCQELKVKLEQRNTGIEKKPVQPVEVQVAPPEEKTPIPDPKDVVTPVATNPAPPPAATVVNNPPEKLPIVETGKPIEVTPVETKPLEVKPPTKKPVIRKPIDKNPLGIIGKTPKKK